MRNEQKIKSIVRLLIPNSAIHLDQHHGNVLGRSMRVSNSAKDWGTCSACKARESRINLRTLHHAEVPLAHLGERPDVKRWVVVCAKCDAALLVSKNGIPLPFLAADGVMRTIEDNPADTVIHDFHGFRFTGSALTCSVRLIETGSNEQSTVTAIEAARKRFLSEPSDQSANSFSKRVCEWGRGHRVMGNLERYHKSTLGSKLKTWLLAIAHAPDDASAVAPQSSANPEGVPKGLGISFASKHLRWLDPSRFAVLDDVLSQGLGYALSPQGYALFMRLLREFTGKLPAFSLEPGRASVKLTLTQVESGIFLLVRQHVRSEGIIDRLGNYQAD